MCVDTELLIIQKISTQNYYNPQKRTFIWCHTRRGNYWSSAMCPVRLGREKGVAGFGISPEREKRPSEWERKEKEKKIFHILSKVPRNFISLAQISPLTQVAKDSKAAQKTLYAGGWEMETKWKKWFLFSEETVSGSCTCQSHHHNARGCFDVKRSSYDPCLQCKSIR